MSASAVRAAALKSARASGIKLRLDGDDLVLAAPAPPPDAVVDMLSRNKPGIVALLRPRRDGRSAEDWQIIFEERAGIAEFDGGLSRARSEALAFASCVVEWLNRNFVQSAPVRCLACGGGETKHDPLVPFGTERTGYAWLHSRCWPSWHAKRKAEAVSTLLAMGLPDPAVASLDTRRSNK